MQNSMLFQILQKSQFRQNGAYDYIALTWRDDSVKSIPAQQTKLTPPGSL